MEKLDYCKVFCSDCNSINIGGIWHIINENIADSLEATTGEWSSLYVQCPICQQLEESGLGHA